VDKRLLLKVKNILFKNDFRTNQENEIIHATNSEDKFNLWLWVYGTLVLAVVIGNILQSITFFAFCAKASENLHSQMISGVIFSPMYFFSQTHSGTT